MTTTVKMLRTTPDNVFIGDRNYNVPDPIADSMIKNGDAVFVEKHPDPKPEDPKPDEKKPEEKQPDPKSPVQHDRYSDPVTTEHKHEEPVRHEPAAPVAPRGRPNRS